MKSGTRLGPYEIQEQLGAGGMGEVYLARDTRLGRQVAIKILPEPFAGDSERLARFEQEARAAAALNHPHIAAVFDVGTEDGTHFMVQEYVQGQSLREKLEGGALALEGALDLAIEVGEALAAAHRAGILHRDLKPDNVLVTEEGHAKVLDFGLAKLTEVAAPAGGEMSASPTMLATVAGQIMGTAGYMAPEQVSGEDVDQRADVFALGCVLYEMVTGRRAFAGDNVHETLSRIIKSHPDPVNEVRADLPLKLGWIIEKALAKRPSRRYESAGGICADLARLREEAATGVASRASAVHAAPPAGRVRPGAPAVPWALALPAAIAIALVAAASGAWFSAGRSTVPPADVVRFGFGLRESLRLVPLGRPLTVSPDGKQIVYAGWPDLNLHARPMDSPEPSVIEGTKGAVSPFVSPEGDWIGFLLGNDLMKIRASGGRAVSLCEGCVGLGSLPDWSPDGGTIVFDQDNALWRVSADGSDPMRLATPNPEAGEISYRNPDVLPGGGAALVELRRRDRSTSIAVVHFETGEVEVLVEQGSGPTYTNTGHVAYRSGSSLYAVPYPAGATRNAPTLVLEPIGGTFGVSRNGVLVYSEPSTRGRPVWVNRDGGELTPLFPDFRRGVHSPRLSPDGTKLALSIGGLWVYDLSGRPPYLVAEGAAYSTLWAPDGTYLVFEHRGAVLRRVPTEPGPHVPAGFPWAAGHLHATGWAPDGRLLVERINVLSAAREEIDEWGDLSDALHVLPDGDEELQPLVQTPGAEDEPVMAPGGRWLAYASDATGSREIWLQEYPRGVPVRVSTDGGFNPAWSKDGSELYYRQDSRMMAVSVGSEAELTVGAPVELFSGLYAIGPNGQAPSYDVHQDGRFLMIQPESSGFSINVVLNWLELTQRVSTDR